MDDLSLDGSGRRRSCRSRGRFPGRPCATASLKLHGWQLPTADATSHRSLYGSDLPALEELSREHPDWADRLHPALPYTPAEVVWARDTRRHEPSRTSSVAGPARSFSTSAPASRSPPASPGCSRRSSIAIRPGKPTRWSNSARWRPGTSRRVAGDLREQPPRSHLDDRQSVEAASEN